MARPVHPWLGMLPKRQAEEWDSNYSVYIAGCGWFS